MALAEFQRGGSEPNGTQSRGWIRIGQHGNVVAAHVSLMGRHA